MAINILKLYSQLADNKNSVIHYSVLSWKITRKPDRAE